MKYQNFKNFLKQRKFYEALKILQSNQGLVLDKSVSFSSSFSQIESKQIVGLLPKNEKEYSNFLDFIEFLFNEKKEVNLGYNLSKGLVIKFPDDLYANFIFSSFNANLKNLSLAEKHIKKVISIDSNCAEAHVNYGNILSSKPDYEGAKAEYKYAIKIDPNLAQAHYGLTSIYMQFSEYEKVEDHYKRALEIDPYYLLAYIEYARYLISIKKDKKEFNVVLKEIEKKFPNSPYLNYIYYVKELQKNKKKAFSYFHKYSKYLKDQFILPELGFYGERDSKNYEKSINGLIKKIGNPSFLNEKANILIRKGKIEEAESYIEKTLNISPNYIEAKINYIIILLSRNKLEETKKICYEILKISPNSIRPRLFLSYIYLRQNNLAKARCLLNKILKLEKNVTQANYLLANSYILENRYVDAEIYARKSLSNRLGNEFCYLLYGKILFINKKYKETKENFEYFLKKTNKRKKIFSKEISEAYYFIANIYQEVKDYKTSKKLLKKALRHYKDKKYYNDIAVIMIRLKSFIKANKYLNKSLRLDNFYKCSIYNKNQLILPLKRLKKKYSLLILLLLVDYTTYILGKEFYKYTISIVIVIIILFFSTKSKLTFEISFKILKLKLSEEYDFSIDETKIPLLLSMYEEKQDENKNAYV